MRKPRPLHQRYQREFWPAMAAYVAVMFLLWPLLPRVHDGWLKIALALLPVVPVVFVVRAMLRLARGGDELEQRIHLIGLAIAATVVSTLSLVGGFLAAANIIKLDGSILIWVWPTLVVVYAAGRSWASRRYGGNGEVMCHNGIAWHWRLLLVALLLAMIVGFARQQLSVYQFGALCCMSAALAAWGLILAAAYWRRRSLDEREAP
ncbi:hypothetical protein [Rhodanobacter sp. MP7CTX1]|uniref:hypothetical protein n=1 Tax=Rhodanobacter sp. MP7CTX1 TaxID=2723084 RepID=UPI00161324E5|nr:hypothetical protein [Rhodanobacter sp. MP7CTX1]MBB6188270.1 hypothetical protein [Rhodanobacter sp. MP7CTX1]